MNTLRRFLKQIFAACFVAVLSGLPVQAQSDRLDSLFDELKQPDLPNWKMVENQIWTEWSKSGSPAMDLLLQRGREAMQAGDYDMAIGHFTALIDHAPDFAEGYNARATAFFRKGLFGPALADIRRTLALNPRHFGAMMGLGAILEELQHEEQALAAYRAAHALHPHEPDLGQAIERLEKAVSGVTL